MNIIHYLYIQTLNFSLQPVSSGDVTGSPVKMADIVKMAI